MLTSGKDVDYMTNYVIIMRICEQYDTKYEAYVRNHYIRHLKTSQRVDQISDDKFVLA